jgi:hypothetical protein
VLGLIVGHELPEFPPVLRGRVIGSLPSKHRSYARLVSLYSNASFESDIAPNGEFEFGGPGWGSYLLLVVSEDGLLAARTVELPRSGPPIEVTIGRDRVPPWETGRVHPRREPSANDGRSPTAPTTLRWSATHTMGTP